MSTSITDKTYKKLSLLVSPEGFSYAVLDTLNSKVLAVNEVVFSTNSDSNLLEDSYSKALSENEALNDKYDEIIVLHDNNLSCFVPTPLFDENAAGSYLQYNVKVFETDFLLLTATKRINLTRFMFLMSTLIIC